MDRAVRPVIAACLLIAVVASPGCGSKAPVPVRPAVLVPPRIDLANLENVGVVQFRAGQDGELGRLVTARFVESARRDQGLVRMVDLGTSPATDTDLALGRERGVRTLLTGDLVVSRARPRVRLASDLRSGGVVVHLDAQLFVRLIEVETGASIWSRSARASRPVARVGVGGGRDLRVDGDDPQGAYAQLVDDLVAQVTGDFHAHRERR